MSLSVVGFQSALVAALAAVSPLLAPDAGVSAIFLTFTALLVLAWFLGLGAGLKRAHGHRVLIRSWFSDATSLREGTFYLWFPEYEVRDKASFGPWACHQKLPMKDQILQIDVPETFVSVDNGTYVLKVNTKIIGRVEDYTVKDLVLNCQPIEKQMHDVITDTLRRAVHDKSLEEALAEIQQILSQDLKQVTALMIVPTFRPLRVMLDADRYIAPADAATKRAMELVAQRKEEITRRAVQAEEHLTAMKHLENQLALKAEEQKVHAVTLQMRKEELMLQREAYGMEGAAQVEASKHAKATYLFSGSSSPNQGPNVWTALPSC